MNMIFGILRGIIGLFVDDGALAFGVICVVGLTVVLLDFFGSEPLVAGAVLLGGNMLVLGVGVVRTARRSL